jgi:cytochrome c biogenesis protein CcdA
VIEEPLRQIILIERHIHRRFKHNLKSGNTHGKAGMSMKNWKIISKIAFFSAGVTFIFVTILAIMTYFLIQIVSSGAPSEYIAFNIISSVLPYLLVGVILLIIAFLSGGVEEENLEEALPETQPAEATA